jgi:hypothetical protein
MTTIHCAGCGQALTRSLELSEHIRSDDMALSTYYIDPEPWLEIGEVERILDPAGAIVVHPEHRLLTALVNIDGHSYGCCGLDGLDGPNQACSKCGRVVGTARTDCWMSNLEMRFWPKDVTLR